MLRLWAMMTAVVALAAPGDVETSLLRHFAGKQVVVKIDMPATSDGVDVTPGEPVPLDTKHYSSRLARHGVSIRAGETAQVTHVEVKDKIIELHLAGGGFQHWRASSGPSNQSKTSRERDLEKEIRRETDSRRRASLRRQLDSLRRTRERKNDRNEVLRAEQRERNQERALLGGSRFNLRFPRGGMEKEATPELVIRALAEWVTFDPPRR